MAPKDYLTFENDRNKKNAALYVELIQRAYGENNAVLVGHHIVFEPDGDLDRENEVPSADTLIFCPDIMGRIFGQVYSKKVMQRLVILHPSKREAELKRLLRDYDKQQQEWTDTLPR